LQKQLKLCWNVPSEIEFSLLKSALHILSALLFSGQRAVTVFKVMKKTVFYESPIMGIIEIEVESVLCQSLKPGESEDGILGDEL